MIAVMGAHTSSFQILCSRHPLPGEYLTGQRFQKILDGGKASNQAIAAAKFGACAELVTAVGEDEEGQMLLRVCQEYGVGCNAVLKMKGNTGAGYAFVDRNGIPMGITVPGCLEEMTVDVVQKCKELIGKSDVFLASLEIPVETAFEGCRKAHGCGAMTILNPAPADEFPVDMAQDYIDVLTPNENEARRIAGVPGDKRISAEKVVEIIHEKTGINIIIATLGEEGSVIYDDGKIYRQEAFPVQAVDTSGAGDCFNAVLACMLEEKRSINEAVKYASAAASLSVQRAEVWPSYPTRQETEDFLKNYDRRQK